MQTAVSILIANFNNGHYFREAFQSLLQQTCENWEAVVIDDCSTDGSPQIIASLIKDDPRFRYYENPQNLGYQKTLLRAIALSRAEIFGRLDPDDTLSPEALRLSLEAHRRNPQAGLVYSDLRVCDEQLVLKWIHSSEVVNVLDQKYYNLNGEISPFSTFKKVIYEKTSGIDISIRRAEDKDIYMKMCEVAPVVYLPAILYNYRHLSTGLSTGNNEFTAFFWHWAALVKMMDRRHVNLEDVFLEHIGKRSDLNEMIRQRNMQIRCFENNLLGRFIAVLIGRKFN